MVCAGLLIFACSSGSPTWPSKHDTPRPNTKNTVFTLPVVRAVTTSATRAEVDETVTLSAVVEDAETPVSNLSYLWTATAGVVTGNGQTATWRLPKGASATPVDVVVTVRVTERYSTTSADGQVSQHEHTVSGNAPPIRAHDSAAEVSQLTVSFLVDKFGNSNVPAGACLVDFSDTCAQGKAAELEDIVDNRNRFVILSATAKVVSVAVNSSRTAADVLATCEFRDREIATGKLGLSQGSCILTAIYEQNRWWLCTSNFAGTSSSQAITAMTVGRRKGT